MTLTLFDFVQQVDNVSVQDIPDSIEDSIDDELSQQTGGGGGGGTDISNPSDVRVVADTADDLNDRAGFTSIQDAIDGINGENGAPVKDGDTPSIEEDGTIFVEPGTYNESVTLGTSGVTLKGPNAGIAGDNDERGSEAIITGGSADTPGLRVANDRVTVDGLQIENLGQDGVRFGPDTVPSEATIQNNIITNIDGNTFAEDLAAGNGIQFQFANGSPNGETANNIRILNNEINDVSTPDNSGELTATGINVLPRGNDIDGLEIDGNTISKIEPGTSGSDAAEARGVIVDTQKDDPDRDSASANAAGAVSGLSINENEFTNLAGDDVTVIALFEDFRISPRVGPENFTITNNEISNLDGTSEAAVFIGGYETLGVDHEVSQNVFRDGTVERFSGDQSGFDPATADALNTTGNTFTDTGTEIYYSDSSSGSDLGAVFDNNTFEPNIIVGDDLIVQPPASGNVRNIDQSATESSIQTVVNNADVGDTIAVGSGTFDETVDIGVDNLTLSGVLGDASSEVNEINIGQNGNSTATTGVTIRGFTIAPDSGIGIETTIEQDSDVTIEDNRIEGPAGSPAAAFFQNPAGIEIRDNQFVGPDPSPDSPTFDNTVGDLLVVGSGANDDGDNYSIVDNSFEGIVNRDQQPSGGNAIEVRTDGAVTIEGNDLTNVTSENGDPLFRASKSTNVTTNNNTGL